MYIYFKSFQTSSNSKIKETTKYWQKKIKTSSHLAIQRKTEKKLTYTFLTRVIMNMTAKLVSVFLI